MKRFMLVLTAVLIYSSPALAGTTGYYFRSDPGDPIGRGTERYFTDIQQKITLDALGDDSAWPNTIVAMLTSHHTDEFWGPWPVFSAPSGRELQVGRYAFTAGQYGFFCDTSGEFEVKEAVYDYAGMTVTRFAVDFVQRCNGSEGAYYGYLRYNSDVPFPDDLPVAIASAEPFNAFACFEATGPKGADVPLHAVNGTGSESFEWKAMVLVPDTVEPCPGWFGCEPGPVDVQVMYDWPIDRTASGKGDDFTLKLGLMENAWIGLTTTDVLTGETTSTGMTACVSDTTPPRISIDESTVMTDNHVLITVTDDVDKAPYAEVTVAGERVVFAPGTHRLRIPLPKPSQQMEPEPVDISVIARDAWNNQIFAEYQVVQRHDMRRE